MPAGISWVAGTTSGYVASATSIASSTPAGIQNDDGVFAFVFARSALTAPAGWTLLASQACVSTTVTQTLYVYRKNTVTSADSSTSFTWSQASANRMGVTYAVVRAAEGDVRVAPGIGANFATNTTTTTVTAPGYYASRSAEMALLAATTVLAPATSGTPTPPSGATLWSGTVAENRLGAAYDALNEGEQGGGANWTISSGTVTSNGVAAITLGVYDSVIEQTQTEGIGVTDALYQSLEAADSFSVSDSTTTAIAKPMEATDVVTAQDRLARNSRFSPTLTDTAGSSDALRYDYGYIVRETVQLLDPTVSIAKYGLALTDLTRIAEALSAGRPVSLSDTIGVARAVAAAFGAYVVEQLRLQDLVLPKATYKLTSADTMRIHDALLRFVGGAVSDTAGMQDTLTPRYFIGRTLTQTVGIADAITPRLLFRVTAEDEIGVDDAQFLKMVFAGRLGDAVELSAAYVSPSGSITTWAINTATGAVTEYGNFVFNSFARSGFKYVAASSSGLYELDGDDDAGTDIVAAFKSGLAQFGASRFSMFKAAYLGMRGGGNVYLKLETGDGVVYTYKVTTEDMRTTKVNLGKGLRARYFSFELTSTGQDFDLESIEFVPIVAQRRV